MTILAKLRLDEISTRWPEVNDPLRFAMRYAPAIQAYLSAQIHDATDAEDVLQDFLLQVVRHRFQSAQPDKGRFRDYVKTSVQRAIWAYHRRRSGSSRCESLDEAAVSDAAHNGFEAQWVAAWRDCLLEYAWESLWQRQQTAKRSMYFTVLKLASEHPDEDSTQLATRASAASGAAMSSINFRQQLSRARRAFARLLIQEVVQTLRSSDHDAVLDELRDLGLLASVRNHLPASYSAAE